MARNKTARVGSREGRRRQGEMFQRASRWIVNEFVRVARFGRGRDKGKRLKELTVRAQQLELEISKFRREG